MPYDFAPYLNSYEGILLNIRCCKLTCLRLHLGARFYNSYLACHANLSNIHISHICGCWVYSYHYIWGQTSLVPLFHPQTPTYYFTATAPCGTSCERIIFNIGGCKLNKFTSVSRCEVSQWKFCLKICTYMVCPTITSTRTVQRQTSGYALLLCWVI
jgi:hypothetical protein